MSIKARLVLLKHWYNLQTSNNTNKNKRYKSQNNNIRNETRHHYRSGRHQKVKEYYKQLYRHKTDNLDKMNHFLIKYKLPKLSQYEIDNIISH